MDIGRAFAFAFDDEAWVKKILIGGAISLVPVLGSLVIYGYMIAVARRVYYAPNTTEMPEWDDLGGYLARGFFFWLGLFLWVLPFIVMLFCPIFGLIFLGIITEEGAVIGISVAILYLAIFPLIFAFSVAAALVVPVLLGRYAIEGRFGALFEFRDIFDEIRRIGAVPLLMLVVTYLAAGYVGQLGIMLCLIGVIFTGFYGNVVVAHAAGQNYRLARGLEPPPAPVPAPAG